MQIKHLLALLFFTLALMLYVEFDKPVLSALVMFFGIFVAFTYDLIVGASIFLLLTIGIASILVTTPFYRSLGK